MFWVLYALALVVPDLGTRLLNESDPVHTLPLIVFPYFDVTADRLDVFEDFAYSNEITNSESLAVGSIDCLIDSFACSRIWAHPGHVSVSTPPHKRAIPSHREFSVASLRLLARDVLNGNINRDIDTIEKLRQSAQSTPLFVLFARENAGDLEEKWPVFSAAAAEFVTFPVTFAFVTDMDLYETFGVPPMSSVAFIPPSMKHITFRGDFNPERLGEFIRERLHLPFSSEWPRNGFAVVVPALESSMKDALEAVIGRASVVVTNKSHLACPRGPCVVDFTKLRAVPLTGGEVEKTLEEFETKWAEVGLPEQVMTKLRIGWLTRHELIEATGLAVFVGIVLGVVYVFQWVAGK